MSKAANPAVKNSPDSDVPSCAITESWLKPPGNMVVAASFEGSN